MGKLFLVVIFALIGSMSMSQNVPNCAYPFDPVIKPNQHITPGEIIEKEFSASKIYPGTSRKYWIYIPAGYTPAKPACLYVSMDGILLNAPIVFDNLIASGQMPVTIGVFVGPGEVKDSDNNTLRFNRSNEFDKTDGTFVRFLLEELLPDVEKQKTKDGRTILFSEDANDRAIAGLSSGAICAFTAAWQRPDKFSRVFSAVGTYVAMRGGNEYPALIRKTEPKPIRIFLQDGMNDVWNPLFGHWYESNLLMESALNFAGYEVEHNWGRGKHDVIHASKIFPDVMRWLWKGYPARVQKGNSLNDMLASILLPDSDWKEIDSRISPSGQLFTDEAGNVIFQNQEGFVCKVDSSHAITSWLKLSNDERLIGTDGNELFIATSNGTIKKGSTTKNNIIAKGIPHVKELLVTSEKDIYLLQENSQNENNLYLIRHNKITRIKNNQPGLGSEIAISPDHKLLMQNEKNSQWIYSSVIDEEGNLLYGQRFYWLHNTDNFDFTENGNMTFDINGNLYVATTMGIQVCDMNGRVRAILSLPSGRVSSLIFGGKNHTMLYAVSNGKLFYRKMNVSGAQPWMLPIKIKSQGAG
ncbi:MAG: alpha/beta hydrolase-fold protein [Bacteroidota bacterium]|nr:alpha/beta hydrolase-fold protein [Bacteroidota bacterium]